MSQICAHFDLRCRFRGVKKKLFNGSGQIIATSHDLTPNGGLLIKGNPLILGKPSLVKYYILARMDDFPKMIFVSLRIRGSQNPAKKQSQTPFFGGSNDS